MTDTEKEELHERLAELNPEAIIWPDFEPALMGIGQQFSKYIAVYSYQGLLDCLIERDGLSFDDAMDHLSFNTLGTYTGPYDPVVFYDVEDL